MPSTSQAEKLWYIKVIDGKAKVSRNGVSLKSLKGAEYGCLLDVSTAFPPHKKKQRMIQVKKITLFYFGMPCLWHKNLAQKKQTNRVLKRASI